MAASSSLRSRTQSGFGVLPIDAIFEILLRLSAKELCRLRLVCRPWRSLLSDPEFIAAHAARYPGPFIVSSHDKSYCDEGVLCDITDLSGFVIKRIRLTEGATLMSRQLNLACIAKGTSNKRFQLLNLANGQVFSLPEGLSQDHTPRKMDFWNYTAAVAFGHVASTGEYKLLRVIANLPFINPYEQLCEVFTFGGSNDAWWRGKKAPPKPVNMRPSSRVAVNGIVYFLLHKDVDEVNQDVRPRGIASFDLFTEEWRAILQGPVPILVEEYHPYCANISLVALSGSLVFVHRTLNATMDLWFLMDFEKGLWVKQHTVQINLSSNRDEYIARPLTILNDGRVVIYIRSRGLWRIYNPKTSTYTDAAKIGTRFGIGLYSGNLLGSANGAT